MINKVMSKKNLITLQVDTLALAEEALVKRTAQKNNTASIRHERVHKMLCEARDAGMTAEQFEDLAISMNPSAQARRASKYDGWVGYGQSLFYRYLSEDSANMAPALFSRYAVLMCQKGWLSAGSADMHILHAQAVKHASRLFQSRETKGKKSSDIARLKRNVAPLSALAATLRITTMQLIMAAPNEILRPSSRMDDQLKNLPTFPLTSSKKRPLKGTLRWLKARAAAASKSAAE